MQACSIVLCHIVNVLVNWAINFDIFPPPHTIMLCSGSLSTYKELCSLASDLNKPELVYKFMHLANHNALWNSRKVC